MFNQRSGSLNRVSLAIEILSHRIIPLAPHPDGRVTLIVLKMKTRQHCWRVFVSLKIRAVNKLQFSDMGSIAKRWELRAGVKQTEKGVGLGLLTAIKLFLLAKSGAIISYSPPRFKVGDSFAESILQGDGGRPPQ